VTKKTTQPCPAIGQVWRENDKRATRYVRVMHVGDDFLMVRAVVEDGSAFVYSSRLARADIARFDGRNGGYSYHRQARVAP
jgi:hypothetical protein